MGMGEAVWCKSLREKEVTEKLFETEMKNPEGISDQKDTGKTVAFFSTSLPKAVSMCESRDYVAKMIQMAGGTYVPQNAQAEEENALFHHEHGNGSFYDQAKDADYIIYNSTI